MNFVTGQPSRAAAKAKAAELATLPPNTVQCLTQAEAAAVVNFRVQGVQPAATGAPAVGYRGLAALTVILLLTGWVLLRRLA